MKLKIGFKNPQHFDCSYDQVSVAYVEIPSIPPWCSRRLVPMVMDPGFFFPCACVCDTSPCDVTGEVHLSQLSSH
jgi:hypothetical protein